MTDKPNTALKKAITLYFVIMALSALGLGLSDTVFSNYFKEVYNITAFQRGLIEFPREMPGVLCMAVVASLSFLGDIRAAIIAQLLSFIGILALGLFTPLFGIMLVFLFINSMGMHLFFPLQDSIGMSLIEDEAAFGKRMGQYKSVNIGFGMLASCLVFFGFKSGFFTFATEVKPIFLISSVFFLIVAVLLVFMQRIIKTPIVRERKRFIFRKEYKYYYTLAVMFGVQKQIMTVFGPWVLIDMLNQKADNLAVLVIIGSFLGMFFVSFLGRCVDKYGIRVIMFADALSFIVVYMSYGVLSAGFATGALAIVGLPVIIASVLFVLDRLSMQIGIIKTIYLRSIAVDKSDIMPTLSLGLSLDHIVSIISAYVGGVVWSVYGPQYIFFLAASLSLVNLFVAFKVKNPISEQQ